MLFKDSGLPNEKLIEDAFNYSRANAQGGLKEQMAGLKQQVDMIYQQNLMMLDMERDAGNMKEDEYKMNKQALDKMRKDQMAMAPQLIAQGLEKLFEKRRVGPAKEIVENADKSSPELVAAVLLIDCVRSPLDYKNIAAKFGESVAGLIAEVVHIDAYPSERDDNIAKAAADTKRAYEALLISSLNQIVEQVQEMSKQKPAQKIMFPPGQEEQLYSDVKNVWGNDPKLDKRFMDAFNTAARAASSKFQLEVDKDGKLELVKGAVSNAPANGKKPPKPKGPGGDGGIGGGVF
jgi:hypothetical protein